MVKIIHIINGAAMGGISTFILNYYKQMNCNEFHFDFVMYDKEVGYNGKILKDMGCKFYTVPGKKHLVRYTKALRNVLRNGKYDVIHVHTNTSSYIPLYIAIKCGIKIRVAHAHSAVVKPNITYKLKQTLAHLLIPRYATTMCACSKMAGITVFGKKAASQIQVIPNGIDIEAFKYNEQLRKKIRNELGLKAEDKAIAFVGRLTYEKNASFAIQVMKLLRERDENVKLFIIGMGPEITKLKEAAESMKESVFFLGQRSNVNELLQGMDLLHMPSIFEGFGIAALEAMASGLPVIVSDTIPEDLKISDRIEYLPITEEGIPMWAYCTQRFLSQNIRTDSSDIKRAGYDIQDCVGLLAKVYRGE